MENYGKILAFLLFVFVIFGGLGACGMITGSLWGKFGFVKRSEDSAKFYVILVLYICIALAAAVGTLDIILLMNHHKGLW